MGGRASTLARRAAPRLSSPPHSSSPHPPSQASELSHLPPRAVSEDFARWQEVQQKRLDQEKWHTQRMLEEQRKELLAKQSPQTQHPPATQQMPTENVNQPIKLSEVYQDLKEYQEVKETSDAEPKKYYNN